MIKKLINNWLNDRENVMSFREGLMLTGLPVVSFMQKGKPLHFLLDTGANFCVINKEMMEGIEYKMNENDKYEMYGIDGNPIIVDTCNVTFSLGSTVFNEMFLINDMSAAFGKVEQETSIKPHGILGSAFFNKYKYVIDFDKYLFYNKK